MKYKSILEITNPTNVNVGNVGGFGLRWLKCPDCDLWIYKKHSGDEVECPECGQTIKIKERG